MREGSQRVGVRVRNSRCMERWVKGWMDGWMERGKLEGKVDVTVKDKGLNSGQ